MSWKTLRSVGPAAPVHEYKFNRCPLMVGHQRPAPPFAGSRVDLDLPAEAPESELGGREFQIRRKLGLRSDRGGSGGKWRQEGA